MKNQGSSGSMISKENANKDGEKFGKPERLSHIVKIEPEDSVSIPRDEESVGDTDSVAGRRARRKFKGDKEARTGQYCEGKWSRIEQKRFLRALELYGNSWEKVQAYVGTRSREQVRSHSQKYFAWKAHKKIKETKEAAGERKKIFAVIREYLHRVPKAIQVNDEPGYQRMLISQGLGAPSQDVPKKSPASEESKGNGQKDMVVEEAKANVVLNNCEKRTVQSEPVFRDGEEAGAKVVNNLYQVLPSVPGFHYQEPYMAEYYAVPIWPGGLMGPEKVLIPITSFNAQGFNFAINIENYNGEYAQTKRMPVLPEGNPGLQPKHREIDLDHAYDTNILTRVKFKL